MWILASFFIAFWLEAYRSSLTKLTNSQLHKLKKEVLTKVEIFEGWLDRKRSYQILVFLLIFVNDGFFVVGIFLHYFDNILLFVVFFIFYFLVRALPKLTHLDDHYFMFILKLNNFFLYPLTLLLTPYNYLYAKISSSVGDLYEEEEPLKASKEDEILSLVEEDKGAMASLEEGEKRMIQGIFTLGDAVVREVMTPRIDIKAINLECNFSQAIEVFVETHLSRLPIYAQGINEIVGVIYFKDFLDPKVINKSMSQLMHKPFYVPESKKLDELLNNFLKEKSHFAIVVDEYGGTSGIITIEDILEEIVGEIQDEFDEEEEHFLAFNANNTVELDARTMVTDINRQLDLKILESDYYETLGGFIFSIIGEIPSSGVILRESGLEFYILDADERKINTIRITKYE